MTKTGTTLVAAVLATIAGAPAMAADVAGVFSQGRTHLAVVVGSGYAFDDDYTVLGVGASYYLADGLNIGLYAESWTGGDPGIYKITPSGEASTFVAGKPLAAPNGVAIDNDGNVVVVNVMSETPPSRI